MKIKFERFANFRNIMPKTARPDRMFLAEDNNTAATGYFKDIPVEDQSGQEHIVQALVIRKGEVLEDIPDQSIARFFRLVPRGTAEKVFHIVPENKDLFLDVLEMPEEFEASFKDAKSRNKTVKGRLDPLPPEDEVSMELYAQYTAGRMEVLNDRVLSLKRSPDGLIAIEDRQGLYTLLACPPPPRDVSDAYRVYNRIVQPENRITPPDQKDRTERTDRTEQKESGPDTAEIKSEQAGPGVEIEQNKKDEKMTEEKTGNATMTEKSKQEQKPKRRRTPEEIRRDAVNNAVALLEQEGYQISRQNGEGLDDLPERLRQAAVTIEQYLERIKAVKEVL